VVQTSLSAQWQAGEGSNDWKKLFQALETVGAVGLSANSLWRRRVTAFFLDHWSRPQKFSNLDGHANFVRSGRGKWRGDFNRECREWARMIFYRRERRPEREGFNHEIHQPHESRPKGFLFLCISCVSVRQDKSDLSIHLKGDELVN
jgi:hypothetical protein